MNSGNPIYTEKRECQDCYKCLRECPVKAIKVEGGYAFVVPELCVLCGHCVAVCPNGAKRVRDDQPQARALLRQGKRVVASLAPSFISEFSGIQPGQIIRALKQLGFWGVSETALGAQQVSAHVSAQFREGKGKLLLSSACPTVVDYLHKYKAAQAGHVTAMLSPLLTHCKILRRHYSDDIGIVFFGPCIAKKHEAAQHPELLNVALTFEDLRAWLQAEGIELQSQEPSPEDRFIPEAAQEGALYPIEGGMIAGVQSRCTVYDAHCMSFSGLHNLEKALDEMESWRPDANLFVELLACAGGCVNGPKTTHNGATLRKRLEIIRYSAPPPQDNSRALQVAIAEDQSTPGIVQPQFSESQLREAMRIVGKYSPSDELNCGGCGYDSCREFARALLQNKAERTMCVTYMRKLAQKKANALIRKMPSAVVIVNEELKIIESNPKFRSLLLKGDEREFPPELEGVPLAQVVPFYYLFQKVLDSGNDILDRDIRHKGAILHGAIFSIEPKSVVGGIFQDITEPAMQKEQTIQRAQRVIQHNLKTVQQIAFLLGENAAESEITLNSIVQSFSPGEAEGGDDAP
jgi:iron only hydrogenase large subunit-like protein